MMRGFAGFWDRLMVVAETDLAKRFPEHLAVLPAVGPEDELETKISETVEHLRKHRVNLLKEHRKAIEAAHAFAIADQRVASAARVAGRIAAVPAESRDAEACLVGNEFWVVALNFPRGF